MQVFIHILVSEGILRRLLRRVDGGIEALKLRREAHTNLERVGHV